MKGRLQPSIFREDEETGKRKGPTCKLQSVCTQTHKSLEEIRGWTKDKQLEKSKVKLMREQLAKLKHEVNSNGPDAI